MSLSSLMTYTQTYETEPRASRSGQPRNYIICIDGTGKDENSGDNQEDPGGDTTNVFRLFESINMQP